MNLTHNLQKSIQSATFKLALSYLAVIMAMSLTSSVVFYVTSAQELGKRPDRAYYQNTKNPSDHELDEWIGRRAATGRGNLAVKLVLLNAVMLLGGSYLSYYLARRTLRPIERAMEDQDRFVADASHELRTPLTSLLLSNEIALRSKNLSDGEAHKVIKQNVSDIQDLKTLSDDLLSLAARHPQSLEKSYVKLSMVLSDALRQTASLAKTKNIKIIKPKSTLSLYTNQQTLTKVIVSLLDNALKYSSSKTSIKVTEEHDNSHIYIHIKDEGPGISPKDLPHIFERFYRTDQSRSKTSGYGLGLSIASKLAESLDGTLTAKSTFKKGSTFTIKLPID